MKGVIPLDQFQQDERQKTLSANKSALEGFAFVYLPFAEGDVGMILAEPHANSVWYLSGTYEEYNRVAYWKLRPLRRHHEWDEWVIQINNDME